MYGKTRLEHARLELTKATKGLVAAQGLLGRLEHARRDPGRGLRAVEIAQEALTQALGAVAEAKQPPCPRVLEAA